MAGKWPVIQIKLTNFGKIALFYIFLSWISNSEFLKQIYCGKLNFVSLRFYDEWPLSDNNFSVVTLRCFYAATLPRLPIATLLEDAHAELLKMHRVTNHTTINSYTLSNVKSTAGRAAIHTSPPSYLYARLHNKTQ